MRRSVAVLLLMVSCPLVGCEEADIVDPVDLVDPPCEEPPFETIRLADQRPSSWSIDRKLLYWDSGVTCWYPPDGFEIDDSLRGVYVLDGDGPSTRVLAGGSAPSWSPDGTQFVVSAGALFIVSATGDSIRLITPSGIFVHPSWSPTGEWIAYDDGNSVWIVKADGSDARNVGAAEPSMKSMHPSWNPTGETILHIRYPEGGVDGDIYTMNISGGDLVRLTHTNISEQSPKYSPDGNQIAFVAAAGKTREVWIMESDGTNARRLIDQAILPVWSPDGQGLAYQLFGILCGDVNAGVIRFVEVDTGENNCLTEPWPLHCPLME